jgi:misacylated tRNA(Ala) deacylase
VLADGAELVIADTRKEKDEPGVATGRICTCPAPEQREQGSGQGDAVTARIDAARRQRAPRFHTATHLLCAPGAAAGQRLLDHADYARLDFHMTEPLDKEQLTAGIARLVLPRMPVRHRWITEAELDANPQLVRSMSVQPPRGSGTVRTCIGSDDVDLQPCGGTHVANTAEIGAWWSPRSKRRARKPAAWCWASRRCTRCSRISCCTFLRGSRRGRPCSCRPRHPSRP